MEIKLKINEGCIGCGLCEGICPDIFFINDIGQAQVHNQPLLNQQSKVNEAIEICPAGVIELSNW